MQQKVFLFLVLGSLAACDSTSIGNLPIDSLEFYIESAKDGGFSKGEDVLAFAAGGNTLVSDVPVSIFFHPATNSNRAALWETSGPDADADDYLNYRQTNADIRDLFQGTLKRFLSPDPSDRWVIVTYLTDGAYHLSEPIRIEAEARPTESSTDRASVTISNAFRHSAGKTGFTRTTRCMWRHCPASRAAYLPPSQQNSSRIGTVIAPRLALYSNPTGQYRLYREIQSTFLRLWDCQKTAGCNSIRLFSSRFRSLAFLLKVDSSL